MTQIALREAIEAALLDLIYRAAPRGVWSAGPAPMAMAQAVERPVAPPRAPSIARKPSKKSQQEEPKPQARAVTMLVPKPTQCDDSKPAPLFSGTSLVSGC
jgi:hypothetical protein